MIKRSTWIVLLLLVVAIGSFIYSRNRPRTSVIATPSATANGFLLNLTNDKLQSIRISNGQDKTTLVERDNNGNWKVSLPIAENADQAQAEAAETQLGALRIVTNLETIPELTAIGLDHPSASINLTFVSGIRHIIEVGSLTPTSSGYYVRFDNNIITVVSKDGIDPLLGLLTSPPYAPTVTPVPTSESTQTPPTAVATSTP